MKDGPLEKIINGKKWIQRKMNDFDVWKLEIPSKRKGTVIEENTAVFNL